MSRVPDAQWALNIYLLHAQKKEGKNEYMAVLEQRFSREGNSTPKGHLVISEVIFDRHD